MINKMEVNLERVNVEIDVTVNFSCPAHYTDKQVMQRAVGQFKKLILSHPGFAAFLGQMRAQNGLKAGVRHIVPPTKVQILMDFMDDDLAGE